MTQNPKDIALLLEEEAILKKKIELQEGLPFLYGWPWYQWALDFYESRNRYNFLTAANQVSKSSTQIRKVLNWATDKTLWPLLWRRPPKMFWYFYPSKPVCKAEWLTKWSQFMPAGKYKDDPVYGWSYEKDQQGFPAAIHFNSGVHVFFKYYSQDVMDLQTGTVDAMFTDEEMPAKFYDELNARLTSSDGFFHMVFTATRGEEIWRKTMEPKDAEDELFPDAFKRSVSLYDSQYYIDGTPSPWTDEKIARVKASCSSHAEFLKRVMGRFVMAEGRKYPTFDAVKHVKTKHPIPHDWTVYEGVDIGGGGVSEKTGKASHKSAICFVAVKPDFRQGRVFLGWRGDEGVTTAGDVYQKHLELKGKFKQTLVRKRYDWGCKDFKTISDRAGESFEPAEKSHEVGEEVINTLFKNDMLAIYEDPELMKLVTELSTLQKNTNKKHALDDMCDAFRYAVTSIPWDFEYLNSTQPVKATVEEEKLNGKETEIHQRRSRFNEEINYAAEIEAEFEEWNDAYGN
jgi:hypothetical protein